MLRLRASQLTVVLLTIAAALTVAPAAGAQSRGAGAAPAEPKPFLDVRDAQRRAVQRRGDVSLRAPSARTRAARGRLRSTGAVVDVDELTGTPRFLAGRAGPLSRPASGDRRAVADRYLRGHLPALGLARTDLGSLRLGRRTALPGGAQLLAYGQYVDGFPSFDGGLGVLVDRAGRVASVSGAAQPALKLNATVPTLTAAQAMRALMANVGARREVRVASGPAGPRRATRFTSGEAAVLVAFAEGTSARLAWQLDLRAGPAAHYAALVDAATGRILYRANRVKAAANDALVWEQYPGAPNGGTAVTRDLTPYLTPGATDLAGPYAHAWSDLNDNDSGITSPDGHIVPRDLADAGEAVTRTGTGGSFAFPFDEFTPLENPGGACNATHRCSWNFDVASSWTTNRAQNAVQAFYFVNRFRDHLFAAPISFRPADGNFDNGDRILVNTDDGASTGPNASHRNNAYMDTPPDGTKPTMAMFLFFNNGSFRDVNGGDDAAIVYHEYTHALSSRLVTVSPTGGEQALNGPQSGAMGEGWSDWYAKDFLVGQFPGDDTAASGEVDLGDYIDSVPHRIRTQALDCPVGAAAAQCPGAGLAGSGGYTYGDFGRIAGGPEVHADGEIWAQTLWDLRAAVGSGVARAIVTQGMRISPPEPTFLDMRDAILTADGQLFGDGDHSGAIWSVFAGRGMGSDALSPSQVSVVEGSKRPPAADLGVSPSPATQGQPVSIDASGSTDADGSVVAYDFDFDGDGTNEITGTANPRQSFAYPSAGSFHPTVTVRDDEGQTDSARRRLDVGPAPTPAGPPSGLPAATPRRAPSIVLARTGTRGRVRFTVRCDTACAGTARLTLTRKLARRLRLGTRRRVGTARVRLTAAGRRRFTIRLSQRTLRAMRRAGVRRLTVRLAVTVTDADRRRASRGRSARIRR